MAQRIDDADPRLVYTPAGAWQTTGSVHEYDGTIHYTGVAGANVTLVFNGTGVGVYGTIAVQSNPGGAPITVYYVDDDFDRGLYSAVPPASTDLYMQRWYYSPPLDNKEHTLVVSNHLDGASMYLDYFMVTSPTSTPSQTLIPGRSLDPTTTGAIIGGVLGGVIILLTSIIILLLGRSRQQKAGGIEMRTPERPLFSSRQDLTIAPFEGETPPFLPNNAHRESGFVGRSGSSGPSQVLSSPAPNISSSTHPAMVHKSATRSATVIHLHPDIPQQGSTPIPGTRDEAPPDYGI